MKLLVPCIARIFAVTTLATAVQAAVPQVTMVTSFTGVTLPPQVTVVPVRFTVDGGAERSMDIPLTCTSTQCAGNVVVVDSLRGTGSKSFTVARSTNPAAAFPLNLLQERHPIGQGRGHTLVVRNGEVWSFGWNRQGQLGFGYKDTLFHPQLRKIPGMSRIVSVYCGWEFSVALDSAGDVWTWGSAYQGELGNGVQDPDETQVSIYNPNLGWSYNSYFSDPVPNRVLIGKKIQALGVGSFSVGAVDSSGQVWVWGRNVDGQLGLGTAGSTPQKVPVLNPSLRLIRRLATETDRTIARDNGSAMLALDQNGKLWGMGSANWGRLGSLSGTVTIPGQIDFDLSNYSLGVAVGVSATDAGVAVEYSRLSDGSHVILAFGRQDGLWIGDPYYTSIPRIIQSGTLLSMATGSGQLIYPSSQLGITGQTTIWSRSYSADAGVQKTDGSLVEATWLAGGLRSGAALEKDQTKVWCWGNAFACAGDKSTNPPSQLATLVPLDSSALQPASIQILSSLSGVILPPSINVIPIRYSIDNGDPRSIDLPLSCSGIQCTGKIQFADSRGTTTSTFTVSRSADNLAAFPLNLLQERHPIGQGRGHTLVVRNGEVWSFGWNRQGQLGFGYKDTLFHPQLRKIPGISRIVSVYCGWEFSVALDSAGDVWTWGSAYQGELGNGVQDPDETQVSIYNPNLGWSYNSYFSDPVPNRVLIGKKIQALGVGSFSVGAVDSSGQVWVWGRNVDGQLGLGTAGSTPQKVPVLNPSLRLIRRLATETDRTIARDNGSAMLALDQNGKLWGMGSANWGRLGSLSGTVATPAMLNFDFSNYGLGVVAGVSATDAGVAIEYSRLSDGSHVILAFGRQDGLWIGDPYYTSVPRIIQSGTLLSMATGSGQLIYPSSQLGITGQPTIWSRGYSADAGVQKTDGSLVEATWLAGGLGSGAALEKDQTKVWCWGNAFACAGDKSTNPPSQLATLVALDTSEDLQVVWDLGASDSIAIPDDISSISLAYKAGNDSGTANIALNCYAGVCHGDAAIVTSDGHLRGRSFKVKRYSLVISSLSLVAFDASCTGCQRFLVGTPLKGNWWAKLWRIDQGYPEFAGLVDLGKKISDTLIYEFRGAIDGRMVHNGVYAIQLGWSGYGRRDSVSNQYMTGGRYQLNQFLDRDLGLFHSEIRIPNISRTLVQVHSPIYAGVDTGYLIVSADIVDSNSVLTVSTGVDLRTSNVYSPSSNMFVKSWSPDAVFKVADQGPVTDLANSQTVRYGKNSNMSEVSWKSLDVDSVKISEFISGVPISETLVPSNGRYIVMHGNVHTELIRFVKLSFWRAGHATVRFISLIDEYSEGGNTK